MGQFSQIVISIILKMEKEPKQLTIQNQNALHSLQLQLCDLGESIQLMTKRTNANQLKQSFTRSLCIYRNLQHVLHDAIHHNIYLTLTKLISTFENIFINLIKCYETHSQPIPLPEPIQQPIQSINQQSTICKEYVVSRMGGICLYNESYHRGIDILGKIQMQSDQIKTIQQSSQAIMEDLSEQQQIKRDQSLEIENYISFRKNHQKMIDHENSCEDMEEIIDFFKLSQETALDFLNKSYNSTAGVDHHNHQFAAVLANAKGQKQFLTQQIANKIKYALQLIRNKNIQLKQFFHQEHQKLNAERKTILFNKSDAFSQTLHSFDDEITLLKIKVEQEEIKYNTLKNYKKNDSTFEKQYFQILKVNKLKELQVNRVKKQLDDKIKYIEELEKKIRLKNGFKFIDEIMRTNFRQNNDQLDFKNIQNDLYKQRRQSQINNHRDFKSVVTPKLPKISGLNLQTTQKKSKHSIFANLRNSQYLTQVINQGKKNLETRQANVQTNVIGQQEEDRIVSPRSQRKLTTLSYKLKTPTKYDQNTNQQKIQSQNNQTKIKKQIKMNLKEQQITNSKKSFDNLSKGSSKQNYSFSKTNIKIKDQLKDEIKINLNQSENYINQPQNLGLTYQQDLRKSSRKFKQKKIIKSNASIDNDTLQKKIKFHDQLQVNCLHSSNFKHNNSPNKQMNDENQKNKQYRLQIYHQYNMIIESLLSRHFKKNFTINPTFQADENNLINKQKQGFTQHTKLQNQQKKVVNLWNKSQEQTLRNRFFDKKEALKQNHFFSQHFSFNKLQQIQPQKKKKIAKKCSKIKQTFQNYLHKVNKYDKVLNNLSVDCLKNSQLQENQTSKINLWLVNKEDKKYIQELQKIWKNQNKNYEHQKKKFLTSHIKQCQLGKNCPHLQRYLSIFKKITQGQRIQLKMYKQNINKYQQEQLVDNQTGRAKQNKKYIFPILNK